MEQAKQIREDLTSLRQAIASDDQERAADALVNLAQNLLLDVHCIAIALQRISEKMDDLQPPAGPGGRIRI